MTLPSWAWWLLAASVIVAVIIMIVSFWLTRKKIVKVRNSYLKDMTEAEKQTSAKAYERENHGLILEDLKPKDGKATSDLEMEFSFNTFVRNGYKTALIKNFASEYEKLSFEKIVNAKIVSQEENYDFALVNTNGKVFEEIKKIYKNLNEKGMIVIVNAPKKSKEVKTLKYDLKVLGYRHEWQDVAKGIILIAR